MEQELVRLTQFSHGGGCGCKIAPKTLEEILHTSITRPDNKQLLVGNHSNDDAAVYDLGNGNALVSTTDFFMPIVDDPFTFGKVAAANSISDVYAMGGKPLMAIAILGWPIEKIPPAIAQKVIEGGRAICTEAGIPLAGGHSIDSPEPIFGLAVTGILPIENLKRNNTAKAGDYLLLTKPVGVGILTTAEKRGLLADSHRGILHQQLTTLNSIGEQLGAIKGVNAMTDVTGFGVLGHTMEMAEGSGLSATIEYGKLPLIEGLREYTAQRISPDATTRNWNGYSAKVKFEKGVNVLEAFSVLPDPQTNGGLLISVDPDALATVQELLRANGLANFTEPIGKMTERTEVVISVA
jgi:selenide, water dikinase